MILDKITSRVITIPTIIVMGLAPQVPRAVNYRSHDGT